MAPLDISRRVSGLCCIGRKIICCQGATTAAGTPLATVEVYDPIDNSWNDVAPMNTQRLILRCAALGGKLYAVGGYDLQQLPISDTS